MSLLRVHYPPIIEWRRHCRNGLYPEVALYAPAQEDINHLLAFRRKLIYRRTWKLSNVGGNPSSGIVCRWHCRTGYGAKRFVVLVNLGLDDRQTADDPYIEVRFTKSGGSTTTLSFHGGASNVIGTDAPEHWIPGIQGHAISGVADVDPASVYTGEVEFFDDVRVISVMVFEDYNATVDDATDYMSEWEPGAGSPIYDNRVGRQMQGVGGMLRYNRGLRTDWCMFDGSARSRSSATPINLIDNATTGTPTAADPGWKFVTTARNTYSAATVPIVMAVYASLSSGTGHVVLRDTAGNDAADVSVTSTAAWYTAAGALTVGTGQFYAPMFYGEGVHSLQVYAVSIYEYS